MTEKAKAPLMASVPTERRKVLHFRGAFAQPYRLQRFAALDVISERAADLPHKSPAILWIPKVP
jgi:hypothetical protein